MRVRTSLRAIGVASALLASLGSSIAHASPLGVVAAEISTAQGAATASSRMSPDLTEAGSFVFTATAQAAASTQGPATPPSEPAEPSPTPAAAYDPAVPGSELTIYVMTMGPGEFVWERFGHNAIWIHDEAQHTDVAYNWGLFSFEQDGFILRFLRGKMDYWMDGIDAERMASYYIGTDRSIWVQELNLAPAQRLALREFVEWNALPENRFYRYDYFRDNCSTRVRDAIDRVLGGALREQTDTVLTGASYRDYSRDAVGGSPLLYTGIMLGLGRPTDRDLTRWEEMFMPLQLMERIRDVTIDGPDGQPVPLVRSERQVYRSAELSDEPADAPPILGYLAIGLLVAAGIVASARSAARRGARVAFRILTITWCFVAGILGTTLLLLWVATDHTAAYANENLFHYNPLILVLAAVLPLAVSPGSRWRNRAYLIAAAVAGLSVAGFVLGLLPWFYQENAELVALALPVNLALGYAAWIFNREDARLSPLARKPASDLSHPRPA